MRKVWTKPADWMGTTEMKQEVCSSFCNGFADDCFYMELESDICYILLKIYDTEGYENKKCKYPVIFAHITDEAIDEMIEALQQAKDHRREMKKVWRENGQTWLSSNGGKRPGPTEEQNRIYLLPWEEKSD